MRAADECGAPIVSIPGGEPLLHPQIDEIVAGLVARKKYVYLCTNALKLEESLPRFQPSKYFVVLGPPGRPARGARPWPSAARASTTSPCRRSAAAIAAGFRVTTNTTLFDDADPERIRAFFDEMMDLGVEGMMISPGYSYAKAPDQDHFLHARADRIALFRRVLGNAKRRWRFNQSPLFLEFLQGNCELECTPWGSPTYNLFGWQQPCYLLDEGYCATFHELMETTDWDALRPRRAATPSAATAWSTAATNPRPSPPRLIRCEDSWQQLDLRSLVRIEIDLNVSMSQSCIARPRNRFFTRSSLCSHAPAIG